jgi:hypothetical protein
MNWYSIFINARNEREGIDRHCSMVPLLGGLTLPLGLLLMPLGLTWHVWFLALLDPSISMMICALVLFLCGRLK